MTAGERLLRSEEVARAAVAVQDEVQAQVEAAVHGPFGLALAAGVQRVPPAAGADGQAAEAQAREATALLGAEIPRRFIAAGAAITAAYAAVAQGDEVRAAGALVCAERVLFPGDLAGIAAVRQAVRAALATIDTAPIEPVPPQLSEALAAEQLQRRVLADAEALERAYLRAAAHVETAALSSMSWLQATGGAGPASGAARTRFGPFVDGLVRWAFYVEAAILAVEADDWARAGAALIAARREVQRGHGGIGLVPPG
jgi:hypothetical protein